MTLEEVLNEYEEFVRGFSEKVDSGRFDDSTNEVAILYLAHVISQQTGILKMLIKELKKKKS